MGESQAAISKIENGYTQLSDKAIMQLCEILEVSKEEIFDTEMEVAQSLNSVIHQLFNQFAKK